VRQRRLLHVSGYPADKPRGTQWEHEERLDLSTVRELFYSIDTCPGHSGAPVWIERWPAGTPRSVVAIHTAGPRPHRRGAWGCRAGVPMAPHGHLNRGVRVTPELLDAVHGIRRGARPLLFRLVEARGQRASAPAAHIDTA
jgi:glutamyl endopeptidase